MADEHTPKDSNQEDGSGAEGQRPRLKLKRIGPHAQTPQKSAPPGNSEHRPESAVPPPPDNRLPIAGPAPETSPEKEVPPHQPHPSGGPGAEKRLKDPVESPVVQRQPELANTGKRAFIFRAVAVTALLLAIGYGAFYGFRTYMSSPQPPHEIGKHGEGEKHPETSSPPSAATQPLATQPEGLADNVEAFLNQLEETRIEYSSDPKGIFIDQVLVLEGTMLNRELNLILSSVILEEKGVRLSITSAAGQVLQLTLPQ